MTGTPISRDLYKTSNKFIALGWIKNPVVDDGDYLIPLAVEDVYGNVLESTGAIFIGILREGQDYRLTYMNSKSKLINKTLKVKINDENWHVVGWACTDDNGSMKFFIDNYTLDPETGFDENSHEFSKAYSIKSRLGGGNAWCPYLYKSGQNVQLYNWRYGTGFTLDINWIKELNAIDRTYLGI